MIDVIPNDPFDGSSRHIDMKLLVYFEDVPVTFYTSDYLIDVSLIEEAAGEAQNPLGAVTANTMDFALSNESQIFTPTNTESPFYGFIRMGIKVEPFICSTLSHLDINAETDVDITWISMGSFQVVDWVAKSGSLVANVATVDPMINIINRPLPRLPVLRDITHGELLGEIFRALGVAEFQIDTRVIQDTIDFATFEHNATVSGAMQTIADSAICTVLYNRAGIPVMRPFLDGVPVLELNDSNHIIDVDTQQSILKNYDGVDLTYYRTSLTDTKELLNISQLHISDGLYVHGPFAFDEPACRIRGVRSVTPGPYFIEIEDFDSCGFDILFRTSVGSDKIILEDGAYSLADGQPEPTPGYRRSMDALSVRPGVIHYIHTGFNASDEKITILFYDIAGNLVQSIKQPIATGGVCAFTVPESSRVIEQGVTQGSLTADNLLPTSVLRPDPVRLPEITEDSFVMSGGPITLVDSTLFRNLLKANVAYDYTYTCEVIEDHSTTEGAVRSMNNSGLYIYGGSQSSKNFGMTTTHRNLGDVWEVSGTEVFDDAFVDARGARFYGYTERYNLPDGTQVHNKIRVSNLTFTSTDSPTDGKTDTYMPCEPFIDYKVDTMRPSAIGSVVKVMFYTKAKKPLASLDMTISADGSFVVRAPLGAAFIRCQFLTARVPVGTIVRISGKTKAQAATFRFFSTSQVLSLVSGVTMSYANIDGSVTADVSIQGNAVDIKKVTLRDNAANPLRIDNPLIQDPERAIVYRERLTRFVSADVPELKLRIRGNPLLEMGDIVHVKSERFSTDFIGVLRRAEYNFTGGLQCDITLMNTEVFRDA